MTDVAQLVPSSRNGIIGILAAGISTGIIKAAGAIAERWKFRKIRHKYASLNGVWIEANHVLDNRPFSVCEFKFFGRRLQFEGHSYDNDAHRQYKWWSVAEHFSEEGEQFSYIYKMHSFKVGDAGSGGEGFGSMQLKFDYALKTYSVGEGYFLDLNEAQKAAIGTTPDASARLLRASRMRRFQDAALCFMGRKLDEGEEKDQTALIKVLLPQKDDQRVQDFFRW